MAASAISNLTCHVHNVNDVNYFFSFRKSAKSFLVLLTLLGGQFLFALYYDPSLHPSDAEIAYFYILEFVRSTPVSWNRNYCRENLLKIFSKNFAECFLWMCIRLNTFFHYSLCKIPKFHLISWCGNFVEMYKHPKHLKLYGNCTEILFSSTLLFLYPLKTSENQRLFDVFRRYKKGRIPWRALKNAKIVKRLLFECAVPLTIAYHLYFLHHGSVGRVQSKECYFLFVYI